MFDLTKIKISLTTLMLIFVFYPTTTHALGLNSYFGGRVLLNIYCNCEGNKMLVAINDYASHRVLRLTYSPSQMSQLFYLNYAPFIGRYVLGSYTQTGGTCFVGFDPFCFNIPVDGTFNSSPGTGTS